MKLTWEERDIVGGRKVARRPMEASEHEREKAITKPLALTIICDRQIAAADPTWALVDSLDGSLHVRFTRAHVVAAFLTRYGYVPRDGVTFGG